MNGIFITSELEGAAARRIRVLQERWDPKLARELPPHVTLIGSSGAGPIAPDTPLDALRSAILPVAQRTPPLDLAFGPPMRFLGREIVVLPLNPHGPLRALHEALKTSGLRCAPARWPFTPHCTLNFYATLTPASLEALLAHREPAPWRMDTLLVYHTRDGAPPARLMEARLEGSVPAPA